MLYRALILTLIIILHYNYSISFELIWDKQVHTGQINRILFSHDENTIYSAGVDKKLIVTNPLTGEKISEYEFNNNIFDFSFTNQENQLLLSLKHAQNSSVLVFNINSRKYEVSLDLKKLLDTNLSLQNQEFIEIHAIQVDEYHILTGIGVYYYLNANHYYKGRLDLWDITTGEWIKQIYSGGMVNNLIISPDYQTIAFSTVERTSEYTAPWVYKEIEETKLILTTPDLSDFKIIRQEHDENFEFADTEVLNELAFSYDSKQLAIATDNHHYFIYNIANGSQTDSIYSCDCYYDLAIDFIYDNQHIITGSNNGKILIWNLEYNLARDSKTYPGNPLITSIDASNTKNRYAIADVKGNLSMLASWEISGVNDKQTEKNYSIWTNNEYLQIDTKELNTPIKIYFYNIFGEKIEIQPLISSNIKYNISLLNSGIYFIQIQSGNSVNTEKIALIK